MSNLPPPPGKGQTVADYSEPLTNAGLTGLVAGAATYFLTTDQQRGAFTPAIVGASAAIATLISQTFISPAVTNTFALQTKAVRPPEVVTVNPNTVNNTNNPNFNNPQYTRYFNNNTVDNYRVNNITSESLCNTLPLPNRPYFDDIIENPQYYHPNYHRSDKKYKSRHKNSKRKKHGKKAKKIVYR